MIKSYLLKNYIVEARVWHCLFWITCKVVVMREMFYLRGICIVVTQAAPACSNSGREVSISPTFYARLFRTKVF